MSSAATRRRVFPARSRGRTVASSFLAWAADRSRLAPPGISSSSSACTWDTMRVWSSPSDRRRSTRTRSTVSCSSFTTGRNPAIRVPTRATEWASVASVLRPWPVAKTRARAAHRLAESLRTGSQQRVHPCAEVGGLQHQRDVHQVGRHHHLLPPMAACHLAGVEADSEALRPLCLDPAVSTVGAYGWPLRWHGGSGYGASRADHRCRGRRDPRRRPAMGLRIRRSRQPAPLGLGLAAPSERCPTPRGSREVRLECQAADRTRVVVPR